jgi:multiple sugar transport system permease protein
MDPVGFKNYARVFATDRETGKVFLNTFLFAAINVPLGLVLGYLVALLVNNKVKGVSVFRMLFYLPVVIPGVAGGILWRDIFNSEYGVMNQIFTALGLPASRFFEVPETAMATLIFTTVWGVGGGMIIWLAAFKNIPATLYEAAKIDGAGRFRQLLAITLPLSTPMIFYNLITGVIGSLQIFSTFIIAGGSNGKGPDDSMYFIAVKIYNEAFNSGAFRFGYASALGWVLFVIIGILTAVIFRSSKWVYYAEG